MNDTNRNTRTLIVSFVIAIMFLIPLRFIEVGQGMETVTRAQVLGESVSIEEVVLPNATVEKKAIFEAPYNEIESMKLTTKPSVTAVKQNVEITLVNEVMTGGVNCIKESDSRAIINQLSNKIKVGDLNKKEMDEVINQIAETGKKVCR